MTDIIKEIVDSEGNIKAYHEGSISIVFLNYNRLSETTITAQKLIECRNIYNDIEIIAVDNNSSDGTREFLIGIRDQIKIILLDENLGIEGYNRGFEASQGDIIIVLDDDSHIEPYTIGRIRELYAKEKDLAIIAFKIVDKDGNKFNTWHIPEKDIYGESFAFVGCGFAIKKKIFKEVGYYPAKYFLYHNEIPVALRVKLLGYRVIYDPACVAVHRTINQQRNPSSRIYYTLRNSLFLIWAFYPFHIAIYLIASRIIISFSLALFHFKLNTALRALSDFIFYRPEKTTLKKEDRNLLTPFFKQNSIIHRLYLSLTKTFQNHKT